MLELLRAGVPGEQRDQHLGVRAAPAGDRFPAGRAVPLDLLGGTSPTVTLFPVVMSWNARWYWGPRPMG